MNSSASPDPRASAPHHAVIAHALDTLAGDDRAIGIAVSGGSDSLALLLHAHRWAIAGKRRLHAATVNHGLRPEAASEAQHVAAVCAGLNIRHETLNWRPPATRVSQSAARTARYDLLATWALRHRFSAIAIGHTRDDRLETFLIRARAGSTWYGLAGPMPAAPTPTNTHPPLRLIRPLLAAARNDLRSDLAAASLDWIDDPTNAFAGHERVRMRTLLAATPARTHAAIIASMNRFAELRAATLAAARNALREHVAFTDQSATIASGILAELPHQARLRLLEALILSLAPRNAPPRADRLARLAQALTDPAIASHRATLAGCAFAGTATGVTISPAPPRRNAPSPAPPPDPAARAQLLLMDPHARLLRNPL